MLLQHWIGVQRNPPSHSHVDEYDSFDLELTLPGSELQQYYQSTAHSGEFVTRKAPKVVEKSAAPGSYVHGSFVTVVLVFSFHFVLVGVGVGVGVVVRGASLGQGNPIALMPHYRSSILVELPNLVMLDDIHVEHCEVQLATQIFEGECSFASIGDIDDPPTFCVKVGRMTGFPRPLLVVQKPQDSEAGVAKEAAAAAVAKEEPPAKKADPKKAAPAPKGKGKPTDAVPLEPEKKNEAPKEEGGFENYKYTLKVRMPFQKNSCHGSDTNDGVHTSETVSWVADPSDETGAEGYLDFGEEFFVQEVASVLVRDSIKFATLEVELWEEFEIPQAPMQEGISSSTHTQHTLFCFVLFTTVQYVTSCFHPCLRSVLCMSTMALSYDLPSTCHCLVST